MHTWTYCRILLLIWITKVDTCSLTQLLISCDIPISIHITLAVHCCICSMKPIRKQFRWVCGWVFKNDIFTSQCNCHKRQFCISYSYGLRSRNLKLSFFYTGTNHARSFGTIDCQQTTSMGVAYYFYWTHQESIIQVLGSWLCALCTGNWKVNETANKPLEYELTYN